MSAKQAIRDKLQGSVGTYLRCGGVVSNQIKKGFLMRVWVKKIKIGEYLAKLQASVVVSLPRDEESARVTCNFAKYSSIVIFFHSQTEQ